MHFRYLFTMLIIVGCSTDHKNEFKESAAIHNEMVKQAEELEEYIDQLESTTSVSRDSISVWRDAIEVWESELVEVPGNEEHHHTKGEHHHDHTRMELTPEQLMNVQLELKSRLDEIDKRVK